MKKDSREGFGYRSFQTEGLLCRSSQVTMMAGDVDLDGSELELRSLRADYIRMGRKEEERRLTRSHARSCAKLPGQACGGQGTGDEDWRRGLHTAADKCAQKEATKRVECGVSFGTTSYLHVLNNPNGTFGLRFKQGKQLKTKFGNTSVAILNRKSLGYQATE